mgnify:CR=1 FL=1
MFECKTDADFRASFNSSIGIINEIAVHQGVSKNTSFNSSIGIINFREEIAGIHVFVRFNSSIGIINGPIKPTRRQLDAFQFLNRYYKSKQNTGHG